MNIEMILQILNWTGIATAGITLLLLIYTCCIMIQLPPKELRTRIKLLKKMKSDAIPQMKRIIEFVVSAEETEILGQHRCDQELCADWEYS